MHAVSRDVALWLIHAFCSDRQMNRHTHTHTHTHTHRSHYIKTCRNSLRLALLAVRAMTEIYWWVSLWKNRENWSAFGKDRGTFTVASYVTAVGLVFYHSVCICVLCIYCSEVRWTQVEQDVSHTSLVPFLQKFVNTSVVFYICSVPVLPGTTTTSTTVLQPFVWDYPGEPVPKETFTIQIVNHPLSSSTIYYHA